MYKQGVQIISSGLIYDEINFDIKLNNNRNSSSIYFSGQSDIFKKFADELLTFPKNLDSEIKYKYSEEGYFSIFLRVFCYNENGHSAIHIKVSYFNRKEIEHSSSDFYITTVPKSINQLGELLKKWDPLKEKEIIWIAD
jgi:hypothetical protein